MDRKWNARDLRHAIFYSAVVQKSQIQTTKSELSRETPFVVIVHLQTFLSLLRPLNLTYSKKRDIFKIFDQIGNPISRRTGNLEKYTLIILLGVPESYILLYDKTH